MHTFLIGKVMGVKQVERRKSDGSSQIFTLVNVFHQMQDKEGFPVTISENVQFPLEEYINLKQQIGKYIGIPYVTLQTKNGTYIFPDSAMDYIIWDKDPFEIAKNIKRV